MAEKVVTNPVSLSSVDKSNIREALVLYEAAVQRRINAERNSDIKRILEAQLHEIQSTQAVVGLS